MHCGNETSNVLDFYDFCLYQLQEMKGSTKQEPLKPFPNLIMGKYIFSMLLMLPSVSLCGWLLFCSSLVGSWLLECNSGNAEGWSQSEAEEIRGRWELFHHSTWIPGTQRQTERRPHLCKYMFSSSWTTKDGYICWLWWKSNFFSHGKATMTAL